MRNRLVPFCAVLLMANGFVANIFSAPPSTRPVEGIRDKTPNTHALVGGRVVVRPGEVIEKGVIVIRDGVLVQVAGKGARPPADAKVWDLAGRTIYAGFMDSFSEVDVALKAGGVPHWNSLITPQRDVAALYTVDSELNEKLRGQGVTARLAAPMSGVIKGRSAIVSTADETRLAIIKSDIAQHLRLTVPRGRGRDNYPNSPMGAVALARQAMLDAHWYRQTQRARETEAGLPATERNDALDALQDYSGSRRLVIADGLNELFVLRADRFAREFVLRLAVRGSGNEYRRLDAIRETGRVLILPVDFPKPPNVGAAEAALDVSLESLMHWDIAPENPARLRRAGVTIALTTHGLSDVNDFLKNVRKAVGRGLSKEDALAALTEAPARLFGVSAEMGSVTVGKRADLVVADSDLFTNPDGKVVDVWVAGRRYGVKSQPPDDARGDWNLELLKGDKKTTRQLRLKGEPDKLSGEIARDDGKEATKIDRITLRDARLSAVFDAKEFGREGYVQLTAVLDLSAKTATGTGQLTWPDGSRSDLTLTRTQLFKKTKEKRASAKDKGAPAKDKEESAKAAKKAGKPERASFDVNFPLGANGRSAPLKSPRTVLFQGATIWTCGKRGVLKNAMLLIRNGMIVAVGPDLATPSDALVIDAKGMHITPGIIDCHSHMATDGGVNEGTQAVTAEVRIGDFINADDINIYRQLAGGVTCSNILHGSANPIGGQNQVIKLRWGALPEAMKFAQAPQGIKFALGENVKQSNWGDEYKTRYPQTRMGVEQIVRDEFQAAQEYQQNWRTWRRERRGLPPRRDLQTEAITEILNGRRWIHCHSYRQDEILALIRTLDLFKVRIGTFQHILEGYKVAPEMARHGAMGSAFSDWWAYKFEVYDAIPYNGALMHQAGVVVSFNSDDRELARRLNLEAAKAVKYGGVSPQEALKFVTLNPARQLRIDQYVGSIEKGKHADLVVWSGRPLSTFSRCEQTWVDGHPYFDRKQDIERRTKVRAMRATLIQKILASGETMLKPGEEKPPEEGLWPNEDIYCHKHEHGHGDH